MQFSLSIPKLSVAIITVLMLALVSSRADALTPAQQDAAVGTAFSYEGTPYALNSYYGIDCSGLTSASLAAAGVRVSDDPVAQYYESYFVYSPQPGDLVFYDSWQDGGIDHVAMYVGDGMIMDANAYWGYTMYHGVDDVPGFISFGRL